MKQITRPTKTVVDILDILKSETNHRSAILDIESVVPILRDRETSYMTKVDDNTLFEIPREQIISARVDKSKMIRFYEYRLLEKPKGRAFYDEIILSALYDICPYCTIRTVKTVDHFLPKSEYPSYSITPINLVPCCRDCNTDKTIGYPTSSDNQTFHPYFDIVDDVCWIKAELMHTEPLSFQYNVIKPADWNDNKFSRASSHFNAYSINQLFSNEANRELRAMQRLFKNLRSRGIGLLKEHLEDTYESCLDGSGVLDWKTLMYQELSSSRWFLDGCPGVTFFN
jgi:hypothetical protein